VRAPARKKNGTRVRAGARSLNDNAIDRSIDRSIETEGGQTMARSVTRRAANGGNGGIALPAGIRAVVSNNNRLQRFADDSEPRTLRMRAGIRCCGD